MTFEEWFTLVKDLHISAEAAWHAGQKAMRERAIELAQEHSCPSWHELCDCSSAIVKAINDLPVE